MQIMGVKFTCSCGKAIEVFDELAGSSYKCQACNANVIVPSANQTSPPSGTAQKKCYLCHQPVPDGATVCKKCGWDSHKGQRSCLTCSGTIVLAPGSGLNAPIVNLIVFVGIFICGFLFGFLGSMAFGLFIMAIVNLYSAVTLGYRCKGCGKNFPVLTVPEDTNEQRDRQMKRFWYFAGAGASAIGSVIFAILWIISLLAIHGVDLSGPPPDIKSLEQKGTSAIPELIQSLKDERVYIEAGRTIHTMGSTATIAPLITALRDNDHVFRQRVAYVLGLFGTDAGIAVPALLQALKEEKNWEHPFSDALQKIGQPSVKYLADALKDEDRKFRRNVANVLRSIGRKAGDAVPALAETLKDSNEEVLISVLDALRNIGPEAVTAVPALSETLKHKNPNIRAMAAKAIGSIGSKASSGVPNLITNLKDNDAEVRKASAEALGYIGPGANAAIPALTEALNDSDETVRWEANRALKSIQR